MKHLRIRSASGQFAEYLREQIRERKWTDRMPGETWLMTHLQVGRGTVRAAMAQLEEEGVLVTDGQGKRDNQ
jgi:DNA-binding GntR family transcriptional regulator